MGKLLDICLKLLIMQQHLPQEPSRKSLHLGAGTIHVGNLLGAPPFTSELLFVRQLEVFKFDIYLDCLILSMSLQLPTFPGLWIIHFFNSDFVLHFLILKRTITKIVLMPIPHLCSRRLPDS